MIVLGDVQPALGNAQPKRRKLHAQTHNVDLKYIAMVDMTNSNTSPAVLHLSLIHI